jgi:alanine racemase
MTRPIRATIRLSALANNLARARERAPAAKVMVVIKANAYGHGLLRVARALRTADGFAVVDLQDAVQLREAGFEQRILLLEGFFDLGDLSWMAQHRLTAVMHSVDQLEMLETVSLASPVDLFVKLNTGMNRLGFAPAVLNSVLERLRHCHNAGDITLMTHFACADDARGIASQLARFETAVAGIDLPVSLANSAALLRYLESARGWVRPGIMLYGASPFADQSATSLNLQPVMTLTSKLLTVRQLQVGDTVGYGATFRADASIRMGVVACGYADGYPRHANTGTPVLVAGTRTRILGRVSMDMLCVDLTSLPNVGVGAPVILWGQGLPVDEVATAAGTVSYELLCALALRVPIVEIE